MQLLCRYIAKKTTQSLEWLIFTYVVAPGQAGLKKKTCTRVKRNTNN